MLGAGEESRGAAGRGRLDAVKVDNGRVSPAMLRVRLRDGGEAAPLLPLVLPLVLPASLHSQLGRLLAAGGCRPDDWRWVGWFPPPPLTLLYTDTVLLCLYCYYTVLLGINLYKIFPGICTLFFINLELGLRLFYYLLYICHREGGAGGRYEVLPGSPRCFNTQSLVFPSNYLIPFIA